MARIKVLRFRWRSVVLFLTVVTSFFVLMPGCLGHPLRDCLRELLLIAYGTAFHMLMGQIFNDKARPKPA